MKYGLLLFTILVAVLVSVALWVTDHVPFNVFTFSLHVVSIYLGVAGVLTYQKHQRQQ